MSETLQSLCNIANGKRRRFFDVRPEAAKLFKQWVGEWHAAATLEKVLQQWAPMGAMLDEHIEPRVHCVGKQIQTEFVVRRPRGNNVNDDLLYLVLSLVTKPRCERLRLCPECGICYVAPRLSQKYCSGLCGRRAAMRRIAEKKYQGKRNQKLQAARVFIQQWKPTRNFGDWKKFVCSKRRDITRNFLTLAVNRCELTPPKGEK